jgi:hypothetical protein
MKCKKGLQMDYLGWILIGIGILVLAGGVIFFNKGAISRSLSEAVKGIIKW